MIYQDNIKLAIFLFFRFSLSFSVVVRDNKKIFLTIIVKKRF